MVGFLVCASGLVLVAAAGAVPVRETPAQLLQHRGMPMALATIALGVAALWRFSTSGEHGRESVGPGEFRRRWMLVALFVGVIYLTLPFGAQVVGAVVDSVGSPAFRRAVNTLGGLVGLACVGLLLRRGTPARAYPIFAGLLLLYGYYFWVLEVTVKRIHFLEYSVLSVLGERALRPLSTPPRRYLWIVLLSVGAGAVEEGIAVFLPQRFGAVSDVLFDTAAGTLGALFVRFVLRAG
ncbi:MAG: VanZ family protein [Candidatus Methylomirabilia bacterium]